MSSAPPPAPSSAPFLSTPSWRPATLAVHAGRPARVAGAAVNEPIGMSATFFADDSSALYVRDGTAGTLAFEDALGALEGGTSVAFASGMAASTALMDTLPVGSLVVTTRSLYSGNAMLFDRMTASGRLRVHVAESPASLPDEIAVARPALVWAEALSNPMIEALDIAAVATAAHDVGAKLAVDATLASPLGVRPLALGADVSMHSVTKAIGGHSDLLMGALSAAPALAARLADQRHLTGAMPGTLETFLALRGLRTLPLRVAAMCASATVLAARLAAHPGVTSVRHPSLPSDPGHAVTSSWDQRGYVVSFEVLGGAAAADAVCASVLLITPATSLGGVETLIERRARYAIDASRGAPSGLLRLSVGVEDVEDLWDDLAHSLSPGRS